MILDRIFPIDEREKQTQVIPEDSKKLTVLEGVVDKTLVIIPSSGSIDVNNDENHEIVQQQFETS
ncbi:hypothetical protein AX774_g5728, partial [Zancudomyces culisetae]